MSSDDEVEDSRRLGDVHASDENTKIRKSLILRTSAQTSKEQAHNVKKDSQEVEG